MQNRFNNSTTSEPMVSVSQIKNRSCQFLYVAKVKLYDLKLFQIVQIIKEL